MATSTRKDWIAESFNKAKYSDVKVLCIDREWYGHKNVLCTQSEILAAICDSQDEEASTSRIHLHDENPDVVHCMLEFLYTEKYTEYKFADRDQIWPALFNVRVFAIAAKYGVQHLLSFAADKFAKICDRNWGSDDVAEAIAEASDTVPVEHEQLHNIIVAMIVKHKKILLGPGSGLAFKRFREVFESTPDIAADVTRSLVAGMAIDDDDGLRIYACPGRDCKAVFRSTMPPMKDTRHCPDCGAKHDTVFQWTMYVRDAPIFREERVEDEQDEDEVGGDCLPRANASWLWTEALLVDEVGAV